MMRVIILFLIGYPFSCYAFTTNTGGGRPYRTRTLHQMENPSLKFSYHSRHATSLYASTSSSSSVHGYETYCVNELLKQTENEKNPNQTAIQDFIRRLSSSTTFNMTDITTKTTTTTNNSSSDIFKPIFGYYNVTYILPARPKDNPVGGKWTRVQGKLWTVQRMLQHVLPATAVSSSSASMSSPESVAQVVNAIRLQCLWGLVNIWVVLRGDAIPLSCLINGTASHDIDTSVSSQNVDNSTDTDGTTNSRTSTPRNTKLLPNLSARTVKVFFDKPRIGIRLFVPKDRTRKQKFTFERILTLGPTSSVVIDTPYVDDRIRLGKGGVSGSQFVFVRVDDEEANEGWKWVLSNNTQKLLNKKKLMLRLGLWGVISGIAFTILEQRIVKWMALVSAFFSGVSLLLLLLSTGGIETRGDTYVPGR